MTASGGAKAHLDQREEAVKPKRLPDEMAHIIAMRQMKEIG